MIDWQDKVSHIRLQCTVTGQTIEAGTLCYSALHFRDNQFERHDYSEESWKNIDREKCISWWTYRVPEAEEKEQRLDTDQLLKLFTDLKDSKQREQQCLAFLIGLLLMRAKVLRMMSLDPENTDQTAIIFEDRSTKTLYRIIDPAMSNEERDATDASIHAIIGY